MTAAEFTSTSSPPNRVDDVLDELPAAARGVVRSARERLRLSAGRLDLLDGLVRAVGRRVVVHGDAHPRAPSATAIARPTRCPAPGDQRRAAAKLHALGLL